MKKRPSVEPKTRQRKLWKQQNPQFADAIQAVTAHPAHFLQKNARR
jgi:hypothetical protein